jgi:MFS family permease
MGSVLYGYDLGVIAEVVACPTLKNKFHPNSTERWGWPDHHACFRATDLSSGIIVSFFTGGAFFGAFLAGPTGDYLGRRRTIIVGCFIYLLGGGLQTGAQTLHYLWAGRWIAGLGVGFLVMIVPIYQGEIAHPSIRGRITALQQFMLGIGSFCAGWISYGTFIHLETSAQWRVPLSLQMLPAVVLGRLMPLEPSTLILMLQ